MRSVRPTHNCTCTPGMVTRYQKRISGPLLPVVVK